MIPTWRIYYSFVLPLRNSHNHHPPLSSNCIKEFNHVSSLNDLLTASSGSFGSAFSPNGNLVIGLCLMHCLSFTTWYLFIFRCMLIAWKCPMLVFPWHICSYCHFFFSSFDTFPWPLLHCSLIDLLSVYILFQDFILNGLIFGVAATQVIHTSMKGNVWWMREGRQVA